MVTDYSGIDYMTKPEAITEAKKRLADTGGITQIVTRRGDKYAVSSTLEPLPHGMRPAEMIGVGNVHNY